ncbi:dsDNA nuclease domain-containing protein [Bacillus sp. T3]|uniref:dsDNA nuclease domain-containing protein n=1 Tax=Bacillus sp. T3 TaxID=467262 RepID=UPI002980AC3C|nr:dsDNA nuclease domain-containing protein [Bacillus sp. T3]
MKNILVTQLREKAGSDSYNRYEYQAHWIVYHMLDNFQKQKEFLIFCEFHDDMAESENTSSPNCMEFFQVKTSETKKTWSLKDLFRKAKRPNGTYKNSFLGFIFYNFHKFSNDCSKCHFISNINFDTDILKWQSIIKDGKVLEMEDLDLFNTIKKLAQKEYPTLTQTEFEEVFNRFVQNTHLTKSPLTLEGHVDQVKGVFFEVASKFNLDIKSGYLLLTTIVESVRKKTKTIISTPISYEDLKQQKGISSDIFKQLEATFSTMPKHNEIYKNIKDFLTQNGFLDLQINAILRKLNKHHKKIVDVSDTLYQDTIRLFIDEIEVLLEEKFEEMSDFSKLNSLLEKLITSFRNQPRHQDIDNMLLRGVFYETILSTESNNL